MSAALVTRRACKMASEPHHLTFRNPLLADDALGGGGAALPGSSDVLPIHKCSLLGDVRGLLKALLAGQDVEAEACIPNADGDLVCGVTPLYLAAHSGSVAACELLVKWGARPSHAAYVPRTKTRICPAEVAGLHFNLRAWWYLKQLGASQGGAGPAPPRRQPSGRRRRAAA